MYKIILLDSVNDVNGPFEVFPEVYWSVDRNDKQAMEALAADLNYNYDGNYGVVPV